MKKVLIGFCLLIALSASGQQRRNENLAMWWSINSFRHKQQQASVDYNFNAQSACDTRLQQVIRDFKIPETGFPGICDGEVIFRNETYIGLLGLVTDTSETYFDDQTKSICVAMVKTDTMYYAVVRLWQK